MLVSEGQWCTAHSGQPGHPAGGSGISPLPSSAVEHAFITDWTNATITQQAQTDIANFVLGISVPPSIRP